VYLSCAGTIDEHFDRIIEEKRAVVQAVLDGGEAEERAGIVSALLKKIQDNEGVLGV
jgi:SNF2 family DNA or RNA helicase